MRLAIGIPCYHSKDDLITPLSSLAIQTKRKEIDVIFAFDGDDTADETIEWVQSNYKGLFHEFYFVKNPRRGGVGRNRNNILRAVYDKINPTPDFLTFLDADDGLYNAATVETMLNYIKENPQVNMFVTTMYEQQIAEQRLVFHDFNHNTWVHGRYFRCSELKKFNMFFPEHTNEDVCFCGLTTQYLRPMLLLDEPTYMWYDNPKSQTRDLTQAYNKTGQVGFVWSKNDCIRFIAERDGEEAAAFYGFQQIPSIYYMSFYCQQVEPDQFNVFAMAVREFLALIDYYKNYKKEKFQNILEEAWYLTIPKRLLLGRAPSMGFDEWVEYYAKEKWRNG